MHMTSLAMLVGPFKGRLLLKIRERLYKPLIDLAVLGAYVSEVIRVVSMVIPSGPECSGQTKAVWRG